MSGCGTREIACSANFYLVLFGLGVCLFGSLFLLLAAAFLWFCTAVTVCLFWFGLPMLGFGAVCCFVFLGYCLQSFGPTGYSLYFVVSFYKLIKCLQFKKKSASNYDLLHVKTRAFECKKK
jgi:hypothetical protein